MSTDIRWFEDHGLKHLAEWKRTVAVKDGVVFFPAWLSGNEQRCTLMAAFDGIEGILSDGHVYLPMPWLAKTYPDMGERLEQISAKLLEQIA